MTTRFSRGLAVATVAVLLLGVAGCEQMARHVMEVNALTTGPNGPETPASVGVPFEEAYLASGPRMLDSYVVTAPATCPMPPVLLIYHGVQETISMWVQAQRFLREHCVSSVVFDYTGSGNSSRPARFEAVNEDSVAVYDAVRLRFPSRRVFVFGHSMGNGPMLQAIPSFAQPPEGVIVASAFSSIRDYGGRSGAFYGFLAQFSPDWWNNVTHVAAAAAPILVIHSDADQVNPLAEGRRVFDAAHEPKRLVVLQGYSHNALAAMPSEEGWRPVLEFMGARRAL